MSSVLRPARRIASRCLQPLLKRAARSYIAGEHLPDALELRSRLAAQGLSATLGYWDSPAESTEHVAGVYLAALDALAGSNDYLSIKLPALRFSLPAVAQIAAAAVDRGVRLHCDSHDLETADQMQALVEGIQESGAQVSYTLPGRWRRSLSDALWASDRGLTVRVVKGQWPDPQDPDRDLRSGFLEVIDRLCGRAAHVAVASHDTPIATEALRRLQAAGTPCSLELLFGLPMKASLAAAHALGVEARCYVPFGSAYLPYALSHLKRQPRVAWWLLKDFLGAN